MVFIFPGKNVSDELYVKEQYILASLIEFMFVFLVRHNWKKIPVAGPNKPVSFVICRNQELTASFFFFEEGDP